MLKSKLAISLSSAVLTVASVGTLTACTNTYHQESTGQYVDSSVITTKVKSRLFADNNIKSLPITVKTYKNIVQLSGFVNTPAQRLRAMQIARNVDGVSEVQNFLVVKKS